MSYGTYTFGLTAVSGAKAGGRKIDDGNKEEEKKKTRKKWRRRVCGVEERNRKRAVREEFETLSATGARKREADGDGATGNRKRPGAQSKNPFSF